jgi:hypothetical protein
MKYVLLFCGTREQQQAWEEMSEEERSAQYGRVARWFGESCQNRPRQPTSTPSDGNDCTLPGHRGANHP